MPEASAPKVLMAPTLVMSTVLELSPEPPEPPMTRVRLLLPLSHWDLGGSPVGAHVPRNRLAARTSPPEPPPPPMLWAKIPLELLP